MKFNRILPMFAGLIMVLATATVEAQTTTYSNIPATLPGNKPSLGYQATQTAEFGDVITLSQAGPQSIVNAHFFMSNWAYGSAYPDLFAANSLGYYHDITLNLYQLDGLGNMVSTSPLHSTTQSVLVPWRHEPSPTECGHLGNFNTFGQWYDTDDQACYGGELFALDFLNLNWLTDQTFAFGIAFNTQTWGYTPMGAPGPYNSLNIAVHSPDQAPTIGSNNGRGLWAGGNNPGPELSSGWTYSPLAEIETEPVSTVPEPATMTLLATGLAGVFGAKRKRRKT